VAGHAENIAKAVQLAAGNSGEINCLMLDMEDASLNEPTIALHNHLQDAGLPVALTLQAYLKRTHVDVLAQIARGSRVRLVKGAFAAGAGIAYTKRPDVKRNSRRIIADMLSEGARENGFYPIIATHDTALQDFTIETARANGWTPGEYEFEMLLGVREDVAIALAAKGERVRVYVPFGRDWWPHAARRIGENPANAVLLARSLMS
jgi:proline dehydrogenase